MKQQQGGAMGNLLVVIALIMLVLVGMQVAPAYIENNSIKSILRTMAGGPEVQGGSDKDIRTAFDRRAGIDNISSVKGADLDITSGGKGKVVSASYTVKTPLVANISLVIDFSASTEQRK